MEHATFGFSDSDQWLACGAYTRLAADAPDETNEAIEFGNRSHMKLEDALAHGYDLEADSSEEAKCAKVALDYVRERAASLGGYAIFAERRVDITSTGRSDLWGTGDVFITAPGYLEYIDLKTGEGTLVDETKSGQLRLNAIGALETLIPDASDIDEVVMTIIQPRYWDTSVEPVRSHTMSVKDLYSWLNFTVMTMIQSNLSPNSVGTCAGHCVKCKARRDCRYRDEAVAKALGGDNHMSVITMNEEAINQNRDKVVYDNTQLSNVLLLLPVIKNYCKDLEEHAIEVMMKGEKVPLFKAVKSSGKAVWTDADAALEALNKSRVKKDSYLTQKLKGPRQVQALKMSKELAKTIDGLIGKSGGGLALAFENDEREDASPQFKPIESTTTPDPVAPATADVAQVNPVENQVQGLPSFLL